MPEKDLFAISHRDAQENLAQDLSIFSEIEKNELMSLKNKLISKKIDALYQKSFTPEYQEMVYVELWAKILLHQPIDPTIRALTDKTDQELIYSLIKKLYSLLWSDKERKAESSKMHGFRWNSALAREIQLYVGIAPDEKFWPKTKRALQSFLALQELKNKPMPSSSGPLQISSEFANYINASVTNSMTSYMQFLKNNNATIAHGKLNLSDGSLCTTYTQMALGSMLNGIWYYWPVRNLGSTWDIDRMSQVASIRPYLSRQVLLPTLSPNALQSVLSKAPAGTLLTLQFDGSHYKKEGTKDLKTWLDSPTHTLISHGNWQFSHWVAGHRLDTTVAQMTFSSNGKLVINGMALTITPPNAKYCCGLYSPKLTAVNKYPPFEEKNTEKMSWLSFAQDLADTYNIPKELVIHQLYTQGYQLRKIYPIGWLHCILSVKPQIVYTSRYTTDIPKMISRLPERIRSIANTSIQLNTSLNLWISDEHMAVLLSILENESGKWDFRSDRKEQYHNLPKVWRSLVDAIRKPDSFGPFQINKTVITPMLRAALQDPTSVFIQKVNRAVNTSPAQKKIWDDIVVKLKWFRSSSSLDSVRHQELIDYMEDNLGRSFEELLLKNTGFSLVCAHEIMKQNRETLITQSASLKTGEVNLDNLDLTTIFAQNSWLTRTYKAIAQYNILSLAQVLKLSIPIRSEEHLLISPDPLAPTTTLPPTVSPFPLDGIWGKSSQWLLRQVWKALWQSPTALVCNEKDDTITLNKKLYKLSSPQDTKQLFALFGKLAQAKNIQWEPLFGLDLPTIAKWQQEKQVHLHYAYTWLEKITPRKEVYTYKKHISQK